MADRILEGIKEYYQNVKREEFHRDIRGSAISLSNTYKWKTIRF